MYAVTMGGGDSCSRRQWPDNGVAAPAVNSERGKEGSRGIYIYDP